MLGILELRLGRYDVGSRHAEAPGASHWDSSEPLNSVLEPQSIRATGDRRVPGVIGSWLDCDAFPYLAWPYLTLVAVGWNRE